MFLVTVVLHLRLPNLRRLHSHGSGDDECIVPGEKSVIYIP